MKKIINWARNNSDKLLHCIINYAIVISIPNLLLGIIIAVILSLVKEFIVDKFLKLGTFDKKDLVANFIGILFGALYKILI